MHMHAFIKRIAQTIWGSTKICFLCQNRICPLPRTTPNKSDNEICMRAEFYDFIAHWMGLKRGKIRGRDRVALMCGT